MSGTCFSLSTICSVSILAAGVNRRLFFSSWVSGSIRLVESLFLVGLINLDWNKVLINGIQNTRQKNPQNDDPDNLLQYRHTFFYSILDYSSTHQRIYGGRTIHPQGFNPCWPDPKNSPLLYLNFWLTGHKFFLKAPLAPIYTNFEERNKFGSKCVFVYGYALCYLKCVAVGSMKRDLWVLRETTLLPILFSSSSPRVKGPL